jgi:hypothetical protein
MKRKWKWVISAGGCAAAGVALAAWLSSGQWNCRYKETAPSYSPDRNFYSQMQITLCRDHSRSHVRLVMGEAGKQNKAVLLEMGSSIGTVDLSWHEGPELHVHAPASAITKRYGPYDELPRVVVTNP